MTSKKYIGTKEIVRLTGLSSAKIYELIHNGELPAHKAPKSGWRVSLEDLSELGLILNETPNFVEEPEKEMYEKLFDKPVEDIENEDGFYYVADEEHYTLVFKRMSEVKQSLKIATADLKNFNIFIDDKDTKGPIRPWQFFTTLVERGVHVEIVCMDPIDFYNYTKKNCPQLLDNPLFELRLNKHNHMKIFIFDDEYAYIGSANITGAAIGKRSVRKRNYEAGMLIWRDDLLQNLLCHFYKSWNDPDSIKHTWKRFVKIAKEKEKLYRAKYEK